MTKKTLIADARLVNEGVVSEGDLLINGQRIERVGGAIPAVDCDVIAADGRLLIPGMIDDQVHFRQPGWEYKGDIGSESRAAVAGGITSYMEMPNCNPPTINAAAVADKCRRAAVVSPANYGFYLGATNDNLEEIKAVDPRSVCGVKVFMGASTGDMLVDDERTLEGIFANAQVPIATHCEDTPTIRRNEEAARRTYGQDIPIFAHPRIRSRRACMLSSSLAAALARQHGARLHILHVTTAEELVHFDTGPRATRRITGEVCVHHLFFNSSWYAVKGNLIKCNPAIKEASDQAALLRALAAGVLDVCATDHAPHSLAEKALPYAQAPAGLPLVQHALQVLLELVRGSHLSLAQVVDRACHGPAELFQVVDRGYLREGYFADLALINDRTLYMVDDEPVLAKCGWTPFAGLAFHSRIDSTWVNGHKVWDQNSLQPAPPGLRLTYRRTGSGAAERVRPS